MFFESTMSGQKFDYHSQARVIDNSYLFLYKYMILFQSEKKRIYKTLLFTLLAALFIIFIEQPCTCIKYTNNKTHVLK